MHLVVLGPHLVFGFSPLADFLMVEGPHVWSKTMSHPNLSSQVWCLYLVIESNLVFLSDPGNPWLCLSVQVCGACGLICSIAIMGSKAQSQLGARWGKY